MHAVTLIKGDGIGPSIMDEAVKVIDASGVKINWQEAYAGMAAFDKFGTPLPDETMALIDKTRLAFKGPLTTCVGSSGFRRHCRKFGRSDPERFTAGDRLCF